MTTVLLDTNVVSFLFKRDTRATLYAPHLLDRELAISLMTVAELFQWAAVRNWGKPRLQQLEQLFERYTLLPVDLDLCRHWAEIRAACSKAGFAISPQDAWIAATALRYTLPLVTHNPGDFAHVPDVVIITEA